MYLQSNLQIFICIIGIIAGISVVALIPVFLGMSKKRERNKISEEICLFNQKYADFLNYHLAYRKIRHDFANYLQGCMGLEDIYENEKTASLKKNVLSDTDKLINLLCMEVISLQNNDNQIKYSKDIESVCRKYRQYDLKLSCYFHYFEPVLSLYEKMITSLKILEDQLSLSLAMEEKKGSELLEYLDQIPRYANTCTPLICALSDDLYNNCQKQKITLRHNIQIPKTVHFGEADYFFIICGLKEMGLRFMMVDDKYNIDGIEYRDSFDSSHNMNDMDSNEGNREMKIYTAEKYGLFHISLTCKNTKCECNNVKKDKLFMKYRQSVKESTKRCKLQYKEKIAEDELIIDIIA